MKEAFFLFLCSTQLAFAQELSCIAYDATPAKSLKFVGLCANGKFYKVGQDYVFVCPGEPKPTGSVELRPYYTK